MKKQLFAVVGVACTLAACSEVLEEAPEVNGDGVYATIEQPISVDTRSFTYENNKLVFAWGEGENLIAIGDGDAAMFRTLSAGKSSSKLESKGFQLMDGITYYAYIPAKSFPTSATEIPVTLLGQRQTENNNSAHLKDFDYACTTATKDKNSNTLQFKLANQIGWIIVEHTFTEDVNNVTSVSISVKDDIFVTDGTLDVATSTLTGKTTTNQITLDLGEKGGDGLSFTAGDIFRGFFTIAPVDLSGQTLTIMATKKDGTTVELGTSSKESANITKSRFAVYSTSTSAAPVATLDGVEYSSLNDAIAAGVNSTASTSKIYLVDDVKENVVIDALGKKKTVMLYMDGHSIAPESGHAVVVKSGEVFLNKGVIKAPSVGVKFAPETDGGIIRMFGCTVESKDGAVCTSTASGSQILIYGGKFSATDNAVIAGNGSENHTGGSVREKANRITISSNATYGVPVFNGKIQTPGYVACGIYAPWKDIITVNAGIFNIENGVGILSRGGIVTINDAEIQTTEPNEGYKGTVGDSRVVVPCNTMFIDSECGYPALESAKITIKGGKYSDNAGAAYDVPDGYVYAETGKTPLAYEIVVGGDKLIDAINNVTENGTVTVDYYASLKNKPAAIKKNFNLEVTENAVITAGYSNYSNTLNYCLDNGNSTITGNGTIEGPKATSSAAIWVNAANQTLTIDGNVTVKGGESTNTNNDNATAANIYNGKLVINNGTFISGTDASGNNSPAIYLTPRAGETAVLEINGGVFRSVSGNAEFLINCADDATSRCQISIKGGTFYGFNPADNNADGAHTNYVAEGYDVIQDGDTYTVVTKAEKIENNTVKIENQLATSKSTATISEDTDVNCISHKGSNVTLQLENGAVITGHGQQSTISAREVIMTSKNMDIKGDGKIVADISNDAKQSSVVRVGGGTVNIYDGVTLEGGSGNEGNYAVRIYNGTVNIYGGYFHSSNNSTTKEGTCEVIYLESAYSPSNKCVLNVYGGVFETDGDASYLINCQDRYRSKCTVKIMGGIFVGFNPADNIAEGANTNFLADGYVSKEITYNGKQAWEVTKAE